KPFDFAFDKDYDTGKLQITVKQVGFVYGWVDTTFAANKQKMKAVETDVEAWKARIQQSMEALAKHRDEQLRLAKKVETFEGAAMSGQVDNAMVKEHQATKQAMLKLF